MVRRRELFGVVVSQVQKPSFPTQPILKKESFYFDRIQMAFAKFISNYYICSLGDAYHLMLPFSQELQYEKQEIIQTPITLSFKQTQALSFLKQHKVALLFGDTGSGKTEIYMKYFQEIISQNKSALFLMPEIALTPQIEKRLQEYFGDLVVLWHSKLTPKQKKIALDKIYTKEVKVIAGPRSALFLPIDNLGCIVVDEEHDDSYKSASRPRYNARDLAIYLGKLHNINVILGSATPSLSSYVKFPSFRLKGGYIQTQKKYIYEASVEQLTPNIIYLLQQTLQKKEQAIVFLPTRANFKYLMCADCGARYECEFCSIGMSIHQKSQALKCHYCNATKPIPKQCYQCGSFNLMSSRLGTAQALLELQEVLGDDVVIEQFDRDVITTNAKLKKVLKRFNEKKIDILVGTQMLSKGHDYAGVTLAVVLGMDNMLNMGDYRSREKALSSLIQIAGRSGRAQDATVYVQTFYEDFFQTYIDKYELFLEEEKEFRKELYPPYKKLCRLLFSHKKDEVAKEQVNTMQKALCNFSNIEIVGYGRCAIERVANKYRYEILLRANKAVDIIYAIKKIANPVVEIDMDPVEFN